MASNLMNKKFHGNDRNPDDERNIGPTPTTETWPKEKNMVVSIIADQEPKIEDLYDWLLTFGKIKRLNKYKNDNQLGRFRYYCCFHSRIVAADIYSRFKTECTLTPAEQGGKILFTKIRVKYADKLQNK